MNIHRIVKNYSDVEDIRRCKRMYGFFLEYELSLSLLNSIFDNNHSNYLPYHNFQHLLTVALNSIDAGLHYHLPSYQIQSLAIAGLCHDADYKTESTEHHNILNAKEFAQKLNISHDIIGDITTLIDASFYPHREPNNLCEAIIQDADLLQVLEKDANKFIKGLNEENNNDNFCDPLFPGVDNLTTSWAKEKYKTFHNIMSDKNNLTQE